MPEPRRTMLLFAVLAAGCTATPGSPAIPEATVAWLARFAETLQFVPPGMQSHWLAIRAMAADGDEPAHHWLEVYAGRDFQPTWDVGVGPYVGVSINDYGTGGITIADFAIEANEVRPPIGSSPVWCSVEQKRGMDGELHPRESWGALVDDRFVISATSEDLLRQALTRDHAPRFGSLEPLPAVPPDTVDLVLRDLAGTPPPSHTPLGTNPPGVSAIVAIAADPPRIRAWGRDEPALRGLLRVCFGREADAAQALPGQQDRHAMEFRCRQHEAATDGIRQLQCLLFFGASIFV